MSTPIENNTEELEEILRTVNALPNASGGGGVSVQADWNQYDETAADFIKNKPFGETPVVVLEEQELVYDADMGGAFAMASAPIEPGDIVKVVIDGESYERVAFAADAVVAFGGEGEDEWVGMYQDGMVAFMFNEPVNHIVSVAVLDVTKLPAKYYDGQSVFWAKISDKHLYTDAKLTIKAEKSDVLTAALRKPIMISVGGVIFRPAVYVNTERDYATVYTVVASLDSTSASLMLYYTAEYTPET